MEPLEALLQAATTTSTLSAEDLELLQQTGSDNLLSMLEVAEEALKRRQRAAERVEMKLWKELRWATVSRHPKLRPMIKTLAGALAGGSEQRLAELMGMCGMTVAGGALRDAFAGRTPRDYDIYFQSEESLALFETFLGGWDEVYEGLRSHAYRKGDVTLDLVNLRYGTAEEIIDGFDLSLSQAALSTTDWSPQAPEEAKLFVVHREDYFQHLVNGTLELGGKVPYPFNTLQRALKYQKYGFTMSRTSLRNLIILVRAWEPKEGEDLFGMLYETY